MSEDMRKEGKEAFGDIIIQFGVWRYLMLIVTNITK